MGGSTRALMASESGNWRCRAANADGDRPLAVPAVSAWEVRWVAAEGEECEDHEGVGAGEPDRDPGERAGLGVGTGSGARRPH